MFFFSVSDAVFFVFVVGVMWCWVMLLVGSCERVEMAERFVSHDAEGHTWKKRTLSAAQGH